LTDQSGPLWVSNVVYGGTSGPAGEMTGLKYAAAGPGHQWYNETRTFNVRGQLTRMTATGAADTGYTTPQTVDLQYNFSGTVNDGRLTSRQDLVSGEAVNYTFDTLGRLTYANNTGTSPWSQTFTYDGFGNLLTETGSGGAPTKTLSVDPTTNRINSSGYSYDLAGNLTAMPGITSMVYDKNNRLSQATVAGGTEKYGYNPAGQRAWMLSTSGQYTVYFYGVKGELLATYYHDYGSCHCTTVVGPYVYFAGKKIWDGAGMVEDRLGSKVETSGASATSYYPFGELKTGTASVFATYLRQSVTGLDYAQQRWYSSQVMRFTNPDPWGGSAALASPQSWNQYRYANDDPINWTDPTGLDPSVDGPATFSITTWLDLGSDPPPGVIAPEWAFELIVGDALEMQFRRTLKPEKEPLRTPFNPCNNKQAVSFVRSHLADAQTLASSLGVPVQFVLAVSEDESTFGQSHVFGISHNYFGQHAGAAHATGTATTDDGALVSSYFGLSDPYWASGLDFVASEIDRAFGITDPLTFFTRIHDKYGVETAGYADKMVNIAAAAAARIANCL